MPIKQNNFLLKVVLVLSLCTLSIGGFYLFKASQYQNSNQVATVDKTDSIFKLRKNATPYQKERYNALIEMMDKSPEDHASIAALIAENYVIDFYTWTNKLHFNDVGGLQYLEPSIAPAVMNQALRYFYHDFNVYLEKGTHTSTLEVSETQTEVDPTEYLLQREIISAMTGNVTQEEIKKEGFAVKVTWDYVGQSGFSTESYQREAIITLVQDDSGVLRIMEVTHEEI